MAEQMPRRHFLEGTAALGLAAILASGQRLRAQAVQVSEDDELPPEPVSLGLIGAGIWGKELLRVGMNLPNVSVPVVCDSADTEQSKVEAVAPQAKFVADYKAVLDDPSVNGVLIATPTYLHRDIVLEALAAGKHVYCEAPLAVSRDDLTAIATAARDTDLVFQPGLQRRCHPLSRRVKAAAVDGSIKQTVVMRSQSRQRVNWMRPGATEERARERSWQAYSDTSLGPVGELGIHQIDLAIYWIGGRPQALTASGVQTTWQDENWEVPDTVFTNMTFAGGVPALLESSVASSHWGNSDEVVGTDATVLVRDNGAQSIGYLFKEPSAPAAGWEVYAKKADMLNEMGILLFATPPGGFSIDDLEKNHLPIEEPLYYALGSFAKRIITGDRPLVNWQRAYEANLIAIAAAEAAAAGDGTAVTFAADDFKLA